MCKKLIITSFAILFTVLTKLGANVKVRLPKRFSEGLLAMEMLIYHVINTHTPIHTQNLCPVI